MDIMGTEIEEHSEFDERIDAVIWKGVGVKPVRQIAEELGISPEKVLKRKRELLEGVDVLSIQEKRQKLLVELEGMAQDARTRAGSISSEFYAGTINASVSAIKVMLVELARAEKADSSAVEKLNEMRVREIMRLVDTTVTATLRQISETYDVDEVELITIFKDNLRPAAEAMDA